MFIVGITILIPALIITLLAASLIVIADEYFTREIKHIIKWETKERPNHLTIIAKNL